MCCVYWRLCLSTSFHSQGYMFFIRTSPPPIPPSPHTPPSPHPPIPPSPPSLSYKMTWNPNLQVFVSRFILKIEIRIENIVWASLTMECPWTYIQSPRYNQYSRLVHMVDLVDHKTAHAIGFSSRTSNINLICITEWCGGEVGCKIQRLDKKTGLPNRAMWWWSRWRISLQGENGCNFWEVTRVCWASYFGWTRWVTCFSPSFLDNF